MWMVFNYLLKYYLSSQSRYRRRSTSSQTYKQHTVVDILVDYWWLKKGYTVWGSAWLWAIGKLIIIVEYRGVYVCASLLLIIGSLLPIINIWYVGCIKWPWGVILKQNCFIFGLPIECTLPTMNIPNSTFFM